MTGHAKPADKNRSTFGDTMTTATGTSITLVAPTGLEPGGRSSYAPRRASLQGLRLGLLGNGKLNAIDLVKAVGAELQRRYGMAEPVVVQKAQRGAGMSPADIEALSQCDVVVNGVGD